MIRNCSKVLRVQLLNLFHINEIYHNKDTKKRNHALLLAGSYLIVGIMMVVYIAALGIGLASIGLSSLIPAYMVAITSIITLVLTVLKASAILFSTEDYEMLTAFPIEPQAIIVSRFLSMYVMNFLFAFVTMVTSGVVYARYVPVGGAFVLIMIISIIVIPLIPMTIAGIIGAVITAISARMKHKNLASIVLWILLIAGVMAMSFSSSEMTPQQLTDLSVLISDQINRIYPMASIFTKAVVDLNLLAFLQFVGYSILIFIVFVAIVSWKYNWIMDGLRSRSAKGNFVLREVKTSSVLSALYYKEWKRYLSSSLYVMNTAIVYVMMIAAGIALFVLGPEQLSKMMELPQIDKTITRLIPFVIPAFSAIGSTTASAISLEGKQWWIPMSLPISTKMLFDSKILVNLTLSIPSSFITSTLVAISLPFTWSGYLFLYVTPIVYCIFSAVLGLTVNARMPRFIWDNETVVIKQSAATMVTMLVGMVSFVLPILLIVKLPGVNSDVITLIVTAALALLTFLLYEKNNAIDLRTL